MSDRAALVSVDLGATSGRVIVARVGADSLDLIEAHRFAHRAVTADGRERWDWSHIQEQVRRGLFAATELVQRAAGGGTISGVSATGWAVDFGLIDSQNELFYTPVTYRDARTDAVTAQVLQALTGVNAMAPTSRCIATIAQLGAMVKREPDMLARADRFLNIADLIHFDLTGERATDWTLATAGALVDRATGEWNLPALQTLGIPARLLPTLITEPRVLGHITEKRSPHPALVGVPVLSTVGHDTASAAVGAGLEESVGFYQSVGTWSMLGVCLPAGQTPAPGSSAMGLPGRRWGLFSGLMGLWCLHECCRVWNEAGMNVTPSQIALDANHVAQTGSIDLAPLALGSGDLVLERIVTACDEVGIDRPQSPAEFGKLIFDSMVEQAGQSLPRLEQLSGQKATVLRLVGGGSQNTYLCQQMARRLNIPVDAGPVEATAVGNILLQAKVLGLPRPDPMLMARQLCVRRYE